jgi:hypothetical protein
MRIFHHHSGTERAPVPGLAEVAAAHGWQPAEAASLDREMRERLYDLACDLYGLPGGSIGMDLGRGSGGIGLRDTFRLSDAGRTVTVANGRAGLHNELRLATGPPMEIALCAVELPTILAPGRIQSRRYPEPRHLRNAPTGNPAFDERYLTALQPVGAVWLTPEVQQRILAHDDWVLLCTGGVLSCVTQGSFESGDDVVARVRDVLDLLAAIPTSVLPDHLDRSVDDLGARIARIESVEDAITFLQGLSDGDRERLAQSGTPLAGFADVRTPDEAMARFQALDPARQMQLMALFMRASGGH